MQTVAMHKCRKGVLLFVSESNLIRSPRTCFFLFCQTARCRRMLTKRRESTLMSKPVVKNFTTRYMTEHTRYIYFVRVVLRVADNDLKGQQTKIGKTDET